MFCDKSSDALKEELEELRDSKYDGLLLIGIPMLNFIGLMDMDRKEEKIRNIKKELKSRGEKVDDDWNDD